MTLPKLQKSCSTKHGAAAARQSAWNGRVSRLGADPRYRSVTTQEAEAEEIPKDQSAENPQEQEQEEEKDKMFVEGMSLQELKTTHQEFCNHCKQVTPDGPRNRVTKEGHISTVCRVCHNVVTQLYKNLDLQALPSRGTDGGFLQESQEPSGEWWQTRIGKLKTLVEQTLVESEKQIVATRVQGKFLPLSVWQSKGYDVDQIKKTAQKRDSAMLLGSEHMYIHIYIFFLRTV